jgi:N-acetylmuramoyl-L-alanine amidase
MASGHSAVRSERFCWLERRLETCEPPGIVLLVYGRRTSWSAFGAIAVALSLMTACGGTTTPIPTQTRLALSVPTPPRTATSAQPTALAVRTPLAARHAVASRPAIDQWPIPFPDTRRDEMAAYSLRHYGEDTFMLTHPKVIVEHYTETTTAEEAYNTFAPDVPDIEFHELPNTCAHFLVEPSGRIDQLVPLSLRCRHTVGLNWTAIGIENVGLSDQEILDRPTQLAASLALTGWLRCRYGILLKDVIGHNESLSSPYHHELVPAFQGQTHSDWNYADMQRYRGLLARYPC